MPRLTMPAVLAGAMLLLSGCGVLMEEFMTAASSGGGGGGRSWSTTPTVQGHYAPPRCYQTSQSRQTCFR